MTSKINYSILLSLLLSITFFLSCKKKEDISPNSNLLRNEEARAIFKNYQEYFETLRRLDTTTSNEVESWKKSSSHISLDQILNDPNLDNSPAIQDLINFQFTRGNRLILNKEGEVQFGDSIGWFNNGKLYFIAISELEKVKSNPSNYAHFSYAGPCPIELNGDKSHSNKRIELNTNMANQRAYGGYPVGGHNFRMLLEVRTFRQPTLPLGSYYHTWCVLGHTLQYWNGRLWAQAGEGYRVNTHLAITTQFFESNMTYPAQYSSYYVPSQILNGYKEFGIGWDRQGHKENIWKIDITGYWTMEFIRTWNLNGTIF